jgi:aminopeptidase N
MTPPPPPSTGAEPRPGAAAAGDPYLPRSGNGGYRVIRYGLDLDYRVRTNRFDGSATITAEATQALSRFSLDLAGLEVSRVTVEGVKAAKFSQSPGKLVITPATALANGQRFTVVVRYGGQPRPVASEWGQVGWEELEDGVLVAGQPCGAPSWFPCDDSPSAKAHYVIGIACDAPYRAVANGQLLSKTVRSNRTVWVYETDEPMAPYLATVQIGRYDQRTLAAAPVRQLLLHPHNLATATSIDFANQPRMMDRFEHLFGPYPFPDYTVVVTDDELEIPLEAHGMAVFGRNHITGSGASERFIAHELAHQWFGNSVTAATWQHIWLHEGFACYAEWLWSEARGDYPADELARQYWFRLNKLPQDLVISDPGPAHMFDDRVYKRGALTLHALRLTIGLTAFTALLHSWTEDNRYGAVTTQDFVTHAVRQSDVPVRALLHRWLDRPKLPKLPNP